MARARSIAFLLTVMLGAAPVVGPLPAGGAESIKIGGILVVTGPAAYLGLPERRGIEMAIEEVNAAGGIHGRKVELVSYDDQFNPAKAVSFGQRLIRSDKVVGIIGPSYSPASIGMIDLAQKEEIPTIMLGGATAISDPPKKWVFAVFPTTRLSMQRSFEYLKAKGLKKSAILYIANAYGEDGVKEWEAAAAEYGFQAVAREKHAPDDSDLKPQLTRIRASGADHIFVWNGGHWAAITAKNWRELGMTDVTLMYTPSAATAAYLDAAKDAANGTFLTTAPMLVAKLLAPGFPNRDGIVAFAERYEKRHDQVTIFAGLGYDAARMMLDAIKRAGPEFTKAGVRDALEKSDYPGLTGHYRYSEKDHMGLVKSDVVVITVENANWKVAQ